MANAAEVAASEPAAGSFADLSLPEWMAAWSRRFHADHGRLREGAKFYTGLQMESGQITWSTVFEAPYISRSVPGASRCWLRYARN